MKNLKKIITISGHKNTYKTTIANELAKNTKIEYVRPYTDWEIPVDKIPEKSIGDFHFVLPSTLDKMIEEEEVLSLREIKGHRYVFFKFQMTGDYNVLIVDDFQIVDLSLKWDGDMYKVFAESPIQKKSDRVGKLPRDRFDCTFDFTADSINELEQRIL